MTSKMNMQKLFRKCERQTDLGGRDGMKYSLTPVSMGELAGHMFASGRGPFAVSLKDKLEMQTHIDRNQRYHYGILDPADRTPELQKEKEERRYGSLPDYKRIKTSVNENFEAHINAEASKNLHKALTLRKKYISSSCQSLPAVLDRFLKAKEEFKGTTEGLVGNTIGSKVRDDIQSPTSSVYSSKTSKAVCIMKEGVMCFKQQRDLLPKSRDTFLDDLCFLYSAIIDCQTKLFCNTQLRFLSSKFDMHMILNYHQELAEQKSVPSRDFYTVRKVDTHIHAAGCMNQNDLLNFVKEKNKDTKTMCTTEDGEEMTLAKVFKDLNMDADELNVDQLGVRADLDTFGCFDHFNGLFNLIGESKLREIFFKTDNHMDGQYFADILKKSMERLEKSVYQNAEYRLSIYGRNIKEWQNLASWAHKHNMHSTNVRWLIQVPRLYSAHKKNGLVHNFEDMLKNIFKPLFDVTADPSSDAVLQTFLTHVSGIDCVDDESKPEQLPFTGNSDLPSAWKREENPSYEYFLYYIYANLDVLNQFRSKHSMNTFALRPHCGEAGSVTHLAAGFLLAESISHGIVLRTTPVLQYLFYLSQMGIAMSPHSNNYLFLEHTKNPFYEYFKRGLNVSLSTDDPMQFHDSKDPLTEEYNTATQIWNLSSCDKCEIARNSVLQSGFEEKTKQIWIGERYAEEGVIGNDERLTNVPNIRISYRYETLVDELCHILHGAEFQEPKKSS